MDLVLYVQGGGDHIRDPVGGSVEFQFVPILRLIRTLLRMGVLSSCDTHKILLLIEPGVFGERRDHAKEGLTGAEEKAVEAGEEEEEREGRAIVKGLLEKKLPESVKRQVRAALVSSNIIYAPQTKDFSKM